MSLFGPFVYKTQKGDKYYLHFKEQGKVRLYFFSKDPVGALPSMPRGYYTIENPNTGMPLLKKTEKTDKKNQKK